jgi:putative transposase
MPSKTRGGDCRRLPTLWSRSYFVASAGAVSAATVQRYIDTQYERPWRKKHAR